MEFVRITDLKKIFDKWSHGTLYNRLESLKIKDNAVYMSSNKNMYNKGAIDLLSKQYLKEFTNNTIDDKKELDEHIKSILSNTHSSNDTSQNKNTNKSKNDNVDNFDNSNKVNFVNDSNINDKYITKELHNEIINNLNEQIIILKSQLEKANAINETLADTIKIKEQKELTIEQEKVIELQQQAQTIKILENQEQKEERKRTGFFSKMFKNTKGVNE